MITINPTQNYTPTEVTQFIQQADKPLANYHNPIDILKYLQQKQHAYTIYNDNIFAGIFALNYTQNTWHPDSYLTTTYILPEHRRHGISKTLKSTATLALRNQGYDTGMIIRETNTISRKATEKSFNVTPSASVVVDGVKLSYYLITLSEIEVSVDNQQLSRVFSNISDTFIKAL